MDKLLVFENVAVSESGFIFMPVSGETFTLNETGLEIFKALQRGETPESIKSLYLNEYDVDQSMLELDLEDFFSQLIKFKLAREL